MDISNKPIIYQTNMMLTNIRDIRPLHEWRTWRHYFGRRLLTVVYCASLCCVSVPLDNFSFLKGHHYCHWKDEHFDVCSLIVIGQWSWVLYLTTSDMERPFLSSIIFTPVTQTFGSGTVLIPDSYILGVGISLQPF